MSASASALRVVQISTPRGYSKSAGITPTIVNAWLREFSTRPTTSGDPPNNRCQAAWVSTTDFGAPRRSSSPASARPSTGATAATWKNPPITTAVRAEKIRPPSSQVWSKAPL